MPGRKHKTPEGQRVGNLQVLKSLDIRNSSGVMLYECLCDCGNICAVAELSLRRKETKSCGCLQTGPRLDLLGQKFGMLTVTKPANKDHRGRYLWYCKCDCGTERLLVGSDIKSGRVSSCGCLRSAEVLTGRRFGSFVVLGEAGRQSCGKILYESQCDCGGISTKTRLALQAAEKEQQYCKCKGNKTLLNQQFHKLKVIESVGNDRWKCFCECGKTISCTGNALRRGNISSCGCLYGMSNYKHGYKQHKLYKTYSGMIARCLHEGNASYDNYGGRGIAVCEEWQLSIDTFISWAETQVFIDSEGNLLQLDRRDNEQGYSPENCRFVTVWENNQNRRDNVKFMFGEDYLTVSGAMRKYNIDGIKPITVKRRIKEKWPTMLALTLPKFSEHPMHNNPRKICVNPTT